MSRVQVNRTATFNAGGSIIDNNSLISGHSVRLTAGGDVGAAGSPINVDVTSIDLVRGNNAYINQTRTGDTWLGLIDVDNYLDFMAAGNVLDGNGDALNIRAQNARLDVAGRDWLFSGLLGGGYPRNTNGFGWSRYYRTALGFVLWKHW